MAYKQILYEVEDHILTLTLNRPDHLNAFTPQMRKELINALDRADADDSVDEAAAHGLVRSSHPPDQLLPAARGLAAEIADSTSAISVALARQMLWRMLGADHPMDAHKVESRAIYLTGKSADASEGITSFLEKRPAKFTGKPSTDMPAFYPWWEERTFE